MVYHIYLLIYHKKQPNAGKYTIHGAYMGKKTFGDDAVVVKSDAHKKKKNVEIFPMESARLWFPSSALSLVGLNVQPLSELRGCIRDLCVHPLFLSTQRGWNLHRFFSLFLGVTSNSSVKVGGLSHCLSTKFCTGLRYTKPFETSEIFYISTDSPADLSWQYGESHRPW